MQSRRAAYVLAGVIAAIGAAVVAARVLPRERSDVVVTTKAAEIPMRTTSPYRRVEPPLANDLFGAWSSGATLYAVGGHGAILRLDDALAGFDVEASGTDRDLFAITGRAGGALVAVGARGAILQRSAAAGPWSMATPGFEDDLFGVVLDDDGAVVVGGGGRIARAVPDAWTTEAIGTRAELHAIARDGAGYVAVGRGGVIATSAAPSAPWSIARSPTTRDLFAVAVEAGVAYAFGDGGTIARRDPGRDWTLDDGHTSASLRAVARGAGTLFAIGSDGTVLRLANGGWTRATQAPATALDALAVRLDGLWAFGAQGAVVTRRLF